MAALRQGIPYKLPPDPLGLTSIDCSLYVLLTYRDAGIPFPSGIRTAQQIRAISEPIRTAKPGDLIFFRDTYDITEPPGLDGITASHIGMSLGAGTQKMRDANDARGVSITDISTAYWQDRFIEVRRYPTGGGPLAWPHNIIGQGAQVPASAITQHWPIIYNEMEKLGVAQKLSCIAMIGTIAHETAARFAPIHEFYSSAWSRYDGGPDYHGRGYIQLTHKYNYENYGNRLGINLVGNPDLALDPVVAAKVAALYWLDRKIHVSAERRDWMQVREKVYGGSDPIGYARIARVYDTLIDI